MTWNMKLGGICGGVALATLLAVLVASPPPAPAQSDQPIRIGLSIALTGPLAPNGKQALLGPRSGKRKSTPSAVCSAAKSSW